MHSNVLMCLRLCHGVDRATVVCARGADASHALVLSVAIPALPLSAPPLPPSPSGVGSGDGDGSGGGGGGAPTKAEDAWVTLLCHVCGRAPAAVPRLPSGVRVVGWDVNARGKPGPRSTDLSALMDPVQLSSASVNLNLSLMRWRALPGLQLERLGAMRCLLIGAGTLGCNVARALLGWGVRHVTLVDNGRVSYSNPSRQPLFEAVDCADGGRKKVCACVYACAHFRVLCARVRVCLSVRIADACRRPRRRRSRCGGYTQEFTLWVSI